MNDPLLPAKRAADAELRAEFEAVLPRIRLHATLTFRYLRCPQTRGNPITEMLGIAWRWFRSLTWQGGNPLGFPALLARRCVQVILNGSRVLGSEAALDVLSSVCKRKPGALVPGVQPHAILPSSEEPRLDLDGWANSLPDRDRLIVELLVAGHGGDDVAELVGRSGVRVNQIRRELLDRWKRFSGEVEC